MTDAELETLLKSGTKIAIVTQAWSRRIDGSPGFGNETLATTALDYAWRYHRQYGLTIAAQVEVADAIGRRHCAFVVEGSPDGKSTTNWNTATVAAKQAEYCREHGITTVLMVAGPFHIGRSKWCYEKHGLRVLVAPQHRPLADYQDPDLVHWVARSPKRLPIAWVRELAIRVMFAWKRWM